MELHLLTDDDLDAMRRAPKTIVNPHAKWSETAGHREKNFVLHDARDATQAYRIFLRISSTNPTVFSAGLRRVFSADESIVLVRYNGPYHSHKNVIERTKVPAGYHRHLTTQRYIAAGLAVDGYAEPASGYNSVDGAFERLCKDCGVVTSADHPLQHELEF